MGSIWLSIQVYLFAIAISFLVALLIRGVVSTLSATKKQPPPPEAPVTSAVVDHLRQDIPVIAAAVYTMLGVSRIVRIESGRHGASWAAEGRHAHHTSHNIVRQPRH
jgi:hypothetical protein